MAALALGTSVGDAANCGSAARDEGASLRDMHFSAEQMQHAVRVLLKARTREARLKLPGMQVWLFRTGRHPKLGSMATYQCALPHTLSAAGSIGPGSIV